jgi:hypothetical protein
MYAALIRASESWRGVLVNFFELNQLEASVGLAPVARFPSRVVAQRVAASSAPYARALSIVCLAKDRGRSIRRISRGFLGVPLASILLPIAR